MSTVESMRPRLVHTAEPGNTESAWHLAFTAVLVGTSFMDRGGAHERKGPGRWARSGSQTLSDALESKEEALARAVVGGAAQDVGSASGLLDAVDRARTSAVVLGAAGPEGIGGGVVGEQPSRPRTAAIARGRAFA